MATSSTLSPTEGVDSGATTPATSLNPSSNVPKNDVASGRKTGILGDTDVTTPSNVSVDAKEATSTEYNRLPNAENEAGSGDRSAKSDGSAEAEDESDSDSESSSDSTSSVWSRDSIGSQAIADAASLVERVRSRGRFRTRLLQHNEHLRLTEARIRLLENRLDELENKPPPRPVSPPPMPKEVAAIPELHFVDWATFKATRTVWHVNFPPRCAIDVLLGEPLIFLQRHKDKGQYEIDQTQRPPSRESENMPLKSVPERIRINSIPLNETLKTVLRLPNRTTSQPLVILRPYKALLYHEEDLRNTLAALEKRVGVRSDVAVGQLYPHGRDQITRMPVLSLQRMREAPGEIRCLLRFVESLKPLIDEIRNNPSPKSPVKSQSPVILFKDLWYIFWPGQYIFSRLGIQKVWRVIQITGGRRLLSVEGSPSTIDALRVKPSSPYQIDCYYLDFDGNRFGPVHRRFQIRPFEGRREITSLDVHPIEYQANHEDLITNLTKRGADFVGLTQVSHKYFKGRTIVWGPDGARITSPLNERKAHGVSYPEQVESPVIVDFNRTIQLNPEWGPNLNIGELAEQDICEVLEMSAAVDSSRHMAPMRPPPGFAGTVQPPKLVTMCKEPGCCENEEILPDFQWDKRRMEEFVSREEILSPYGVDKDYVVSEEQLRLLPNRVFGFVLRSRKWACFPIDCLRDVVKHSTNFDALELTGQHKEIVVGLVDTHFKNREKESHSPTGGIQEDQDFDLVRAKGKGLIILLHGAPGVGKTSTAECVAETHGKPLFPITCGDLGVDPIDVEKGLEFNFQLAESWGCVLLLDEADVFLAQRGERDLSRNALVSIFLRALEYYSGILFLTTNRVGTIDEAFRSRIHMSLFYPNLNEQQTIQIWRGQLKRALERDPNLIVDEDAILKYARELHLLQVRVAKVGWNGRQIRNAMKTAISLAEYDCFRRSEATQTKAQVVLEVRWFEVVARASWEFNAYLQRALDMSATEIAKDWGRRDDEANPWELVMPPFMGDSSAIRPSLYGQQVVQQRQYPASHPSLFAAAGGAPTQNTMFGLPQHSFAPAQQAHSYSSPQYLSTNQAQQQQNAHSQVPLVAGRYPPEFPMGNVGMPSEAPIPAVPQSAPNPTGVNQFPLQPGQQQLFGNYGQYDGTNPQAQHLMPGYLQSTQAATPMFSGYQDPVASSSTHGQPIRPPSATQPPPQQTTEPSSQSLQPGVGQPQQ